MSKTTDVAIVNSLCDRIEALDRDVQRLYWSALARLHGTPPPEPRAGEAGGEEWPQFPTHLAAAAWAFAGILDNSHFEELMVGVQRWRERPEAEG